MQKITENVQKFARPVASEKNTSRSFKKIIGARGLSEKLADYKKSFN
jgi:hypothetical protein